MNIRETTIDDVPQLARIRYASFPYFTASVACQENWFRTLVPEGRTLRLAAEVDGKIVGFGHSQLNVTTREKGVGSIALTVDPAHRGQGVGTALLERLEAHMREIEGKRVQVWTDDEPGALRFAEKHGYTRGARDRYSKVDTSVLPAMPAIPAGVELKNLLEVGPEAVYQLDLAGSADEPGDVSFDGVPFDVWMQRYWNSPDAVHEISTVAVVNGVAAAGSFLEANHELGKAMSTGACTLPDYRGRGLAKLAKWATLDKAAKAGIHTAITCNDYENGPMLAINDWFGYEVFCGEYSYLKSY